jgi:tritrans,polycis-undecaprenyl-diphosphate synthase [geranylgeranyl-diphosphate specific]
MSSEEHTSGLDEVLLGFMESRLGRLVMSLSSKAKDKILQSELGKSAKGFLEKIYEAHLFREVMKRPVPKHIAIIVDGNRRYAMEMGIDIYKGHEVGGKRLKDLAEWCHDLGVKVVTLYVFSTENFKRDRAEVDHLMGLFKKYFREAGDAEEVHKYKIRIRAIGQLGLLPDGVREAIRYAEEKTKDYRDYLVNVAIAYGGREEIIQAIRKIALEAKNDGLDIESIDERFVSKHLYTEGAPDPDLVLRTSGEERISNFLIWQLAYSELYFADIYWPQISKVDFLRAIKSYQQRERRFGL